MTETLDRAENFLLEGDNAAAAATAQMGLKGQERESTPDSAAAKQQSSSPLSSSSYYQHRLVAVLAQAQFLSGQKQQACSTLREHIQSSLTALSRYQQSGGKPDEQALRDSFQQLLVDLHLFSELGSNCNSTTPAALNSFRRDFESLLLSLHMALLSTEALRLTSPPSPNEEVDERREGDDGDDDEGQSDLKQGLRDVLTSFFLATLYPLSDSGKDSLVSDFEEGYSQMITMCDFKRPAHHPPAKVVKPHQKNSAPTAQQAAAANVDDDDDDMGSSANSLAAVIPTAVSSTSSTAPSTVLDQLVQGFRSALIWTNRNPAALAAVSVIVSWVIGLLLRRLIFGGGGAGGSAAVGPRKLVL